MRSIRALVIASLCAATAVAEPPKAAFPGAGTSVVVNRTNGKVAVSTEGRLLVFDRFGAATPSLEAELPGVGAAVREFAGSNLVYSTTGINEGELTKVAITDQGMERLAWPNEGLSERFPTESSRLTLDGKGLFDRLVLDDEVRAYFELGEEIPTGAGVLATFRFAGEKMAARASEAFAAVLALTPDDLLVVNRRGGLMRYQAGHGVTWKLEEGSAGEWQLLDALPERKAGLALDGRGALVAVDLEQGQVIWQWEPWAHEQELDAWLGGTAPQPQAAGSPSPRPTATPLPHLAARVVDARFLGDGRVLVLGKRGETFLGVLDGSKGALAGQELVSSARGQGLAAVFSLWREKAAYLAWAQELSTPLGPALLLKGSDGWYALPLPR